MKYDLNDILSELDLLGDDMHANIRTMHDNIVNDVLCFRENISAAKYDMDRMSDEIIKGDLCESGSKLYLTTITDECAEFLLLSCKSIGEVFYNTWLKDMDYESFPECFFDNKNNNACRYIHLISTLISCLIEDNSSDNHINMIKVMLSESIKDNTDTVQALCISFGSVIYNSVMLQQKMCIHISNKIKEINKLKLSRASARPKSQEYDEVMSIINRTVIKFSNASVTSLIEKVSGYYDSQNRKPPTKNTLRKWIADSGYKPDGKPTNKYKLEV